MQMSLRWFGTGYDSVTLEKIRQIPGVTGVISTLYSTTPGEVAVDPGPAPVVLPSTITGQTAAQVTCTVPEY